MKNKIIVKLFALVLSLFPFLASANNNATGGWSVPTGYGLPEGTISGIVSNFAMWILAILGIIGIIGFVISGIMYLTSAGNDDMIKKAKSAMVASIIGVVVGLAGIVVMLAIEAALDATPDF